MNRSGTNLLKVWDYNMAVVLDLIRKHGPISRREISVRSGLSFQTVSNISQTLIASGVTAEGTELLGDGVRQARALRLCPNAAYVVGIHLDRAKLLECWSVGVLALRYKKRAKLVSLWIGCYAGTGQKIEIASFVCLGNVAGI
jgi:hypothetical protein